MAQKYELVVGLEVHARIKTKSKLWCSCDAY
jgi:aspartyl-tRNA(Asn)/glutamyl-tRNA(Gln) amidotransferase subunit B